MATRNNSRSGGNRPRTHPTRTVKSTKTPRRTAGRTPAETRPRISAAIEIAIDEQRDSLGTAISILYCLHSTLRYQDAGASRFEIEALEDAAQWAELTDITAMLLVRLNGIHTALDSTELVKAKVDPEQLEMAEAVRKMGIGSDEREAS
jgi:hypothetical protein